MPGRQQALIWSSFLLLVTAVTSHAQQDEPDLPPAPPIATAGAVASNVTELRLFLTDVPGVVVGEIAIAGRSTLAEFSVAMEKEVGTVTFHDDGEWPDRMKGDGVFSARFGYDTSKEFEQLRAGLKLTIDVLRDPGQQVLIWRGPRDIVAATDAVRDAERTMKEALAGARDKLERAVSLLNFQDPLDAARALGMDTSTIPFLRVPGPRFDEIPGKRFKVDYLFDFPILASFPPSSSAIPIDEDRSLLITATKVVEDESFSFDACTGSGSAGGAWSFGHLMRELAYGTGVSPEEFTKRWLLTWQTPQRVNEWTIGDSRGRRLQLRIIESWQRLSGGALDVDYFPARLLAIVNRPDLAGGVGYGAGGSAGEGRFVFGLMFKPAGTAPCYPIKFTMIFEYGIAASSCMEVEAWQRRWKDLDHFDLGTSDYNRELESITRAFTDHGSDPGQLPNTSSLSALRTNETELGLSWEWREFRLQQKDGLLHLVTVKQTPAKRFQSGSSTLRSYLGKFEAEILGDRHVVREHFPPSTPFLGAVANTELSTFFWTAPDLGTLAQPVETRRKFSLATCNGCHSGETETPFTHIGIEGARNMGEEAWRSPFLLGETVIVPGTQGTVTHAYSDLNEREGKMSDLLTDYCFRLLGFRQLPFVH
jgi:hypothetical protein